MADRPADRRTGAVGARPVNDPDRKPGPLAAELDLYSVRDHVGFTLDLERGTCDGCRFSLPLVDVELDDGTTVRWCQRCLLLDAR